MNTIGIKMLVSCLFLTMALALAGCGGGGGGGDSSNSAKPGTYKFTYEMLTGNTYNLSCVSPNINGGKYTFNANGSYTFTLPNIGTGSNSWSINSLGQLILGGTDVLTPDSSSTTAIPTTNQVGGNLTMILVNPSAPTYKFTNEMIIGKNYKYTRNDGLSASITYVANGTANITSKDGTVTAIWSINDSGQLKLLFNDTSYDVLTPTSDSKTSIPVTDQYTDPKAPGDNTTYIATMTLVN